MQKLNLVYTSNGNLFVFSLLHYNFFVTYPKNFGCARMRACMRVCGCVCVNK